MSRGHEMAANTETGGGQSAGGAAGSDDRVNEQLRVAFKDFLRPTPQQNSGEDVQSLHSGVTPRLDLEALERKSIDDRIGAIENQTKKRSSRGFTRYLLAICIGVAATLAWQSYGEAAKQLFAANAPELGWSPETKQMIANWVEQLGWTKPPQTAAPPEVPPSVPVASIDQAEVHQIAMDIAALRQTVAQITAGQDQMARKFDTLQAANQQILAKMIPEPPPAPPIAAAPAISPGVAPPSENKQNTAPTSASIALRASCGPDVKRLCRGISIENGDVIKCLSSHRMELSPTCDMYFNEMAVHRAAQTKPKPVTPPSSRAPVPPYIPPHP
jgi:Cysteine rich repeat